MDAFTSLLCFCMCVFVALKIVIISPQQGQTIDPSGHLNVIKTTSSSKAVELFTQGMKRFLVPQLFLFHLPSALDFKEVNGGQCGGIMTVLHSVWPLRLTRQGTLRLT